MLGKERREERSGKENKFINQYLEFQELDLGHYWISAELGIILLNFFLKGWVV